MGLARRSELGPIVRGYGLPPHQGEPPRVITARVLHLPREDGGLAIKVFPAEQQAQAQTEASLLARLAGGEGYRVQQLLRTASGEALLELDDRRILVTRWEPGVHRMYRDLDAAAWTELGRTLASLHLRLDDTDTEALPLRSFVDELRRRDLDDDRRLLAEHRQRAETCSAPGATLLPRLLADRAALLERHATSSQARMPDGADDRPIHNDYNVHNYLFPAHGPPTILDWERAVRAPREFEVCRCLNHLPLVAPAHAWAFVEGYLQRRSLDPDRIAWALDAAVAMHALKHWPVEPCLRGEPGAAERIAGMAEIVRAFVEGRSRLDAFADDLRARIRDHDRARDHEPRP